MPYVVRWKFNADDSPRESPKAYSSPAAAIDFACAILKEHPLEIWIDGPGDLRIERNVIVRHCRDRGAL
jgi:hypothetical protein